MRLIEKPQSNTTRPDPNIVAGEIKVELQPITYQHRNPTEFHTGSFRCFAPTHHNAVIIGSTVQDNHTSGLQYVLDASTIEYIKDDDNVTTGIAMVLAAGCQNSQNHHHDAKVTKNTKNICKTFLNNAQITDHALTLANKTLVLGNNDSANHTALIAATLSSDTNEAHCINIGNTAVIVISGETHNVKHIFSPRKCEIINGDSRVPIHLQSLIAKPFPILSLDYGDIQLQADDIIILASAGFVETLPATEKNYTVDMEKMTFSSGERANTTLCIAHRDKFTYIRNEIDVPKINHKLQGIFQNLQTHYPNTQPPAFAIAEALIKDAAPSTLQINKEKLAFAQQIRDLIVRYHVACTPYTAQEIVRFKFNLIDYFIKWCKEHYTETQLGSKLEKYVEENFINIKGTVADLEAYFSLENMKFGSDTTIAVAYVPDPALEIVRAMINYTANKSFNDPYCKYHRDQLWQRFSKLKPTTELLTQIISKLHTEMHVENAGHTASSTEGQKLEELKSHVVRSYSDEEILTAIQFLLPKVKLPQELQEIHSVKDIVHKADAHTKLQEILCRVDLNVVERCGVYNELTPQQFAKLNTHRHRIVDKWFGINITRSWSQTLKVIRDNCLQKLMEEVRELQDTQQYDKALLILNHLLEQPLFNTHRNNKKITGAYGDTAAVMVIRKMIKEVTAAKEGVDNISQLKA